MKLQNHTIAENGDIIFDGRFNMSTLHLYSPEELKYIREAGLMWSDLNQSMSTSQKTMMNAIYGATANKHYYFASYESADDITAEGRFYIHLGEKTINDYFKKAWHLDTELHEHLRNHEELKNSFDPNQTEVKQLDQRKDYVYYIDTDSLYVTFEYIMLSIGFDAKKEDKYARFIMEMNAFRLRGLFQDKLGEVISDRNGENFLVFDLESISESTVFVVKKKYIMSLKMEDDKIYDDPLKHIKAKGLELAKASMAQTVKNMIKFIITLLFKEKLDSNNYKSYMRYMYKQFCELPIQMRCELGNCNTYEKNVLNDTTNVELAKGATANVRGMANYNFDLKKNGLQTKYEPLKGGKIAWYYTTDDRISYAFNIDEYPEEIAPPIDNVRQFMKLVGDPVARIVTCAGIDISNPLSAQTSIKI